MSERLAEVPIEELLAYPPNCPDVLVTQEGHSLINVENRNPIIGYRGNRRDLNVRPENSGYEPSDILYFGDVEITITCIGGGGIALMQEPARDKNGKLSPNILENFHSAPIKLGGFITVPRNHSIAFVVTDDRLVLRDDSPEKFKSLQPNQFPDIAPLNLTRQTGFLYSVVMRGEEPKLLRNISLSAKKEFLNGIKTVEMH